jgi:hypothetical protein
MVDRNSIFVIDTLENFLSFTQPFIDNVTYIFRIFQIWKNLYQVSWEDNIKIDLQEMGFGSTDCIELAQDRDRRRPL